MTKVPTYTSQEELRPTPLNPETAAHLGNEVVDVSQGLEGLGETIQKLDDRRQSLKAEIYLAKSHNDNLKMVSTDPDLDTLEDRLDAKSQESISTAADMIKSPEARDNFISKATIDQDRRNAPLYRTIMSRKSQDFKSQLVQANDADVQEYTTLADPDERKLLRQKILDRTQQAIQDGHVNADWARAHVGTLLKSADINQVKSDMSIDATHTYEQLQKGKDGLYPYLNDAQRKYFADNAQKFIAKQGSDNKLIYSIAQNHAENTLLDKMANNQLTVQDVNNAGLYGIKGIKPRPAFVKAAQDALNDPFPTESVPDKYNKLVDDIQDPSIDPMTLKMNVLTARGLTPQEKAHLINAHLREDEEDGKQSINTLINNGIKQNKTALMQAQRNLQTELASRQTFLRKITDRFRDHAQDDAHLASLQQDYYSKLNNVKDDKERMELAQQILNHDTLIHNPGIATSDPKGTIFYNKVTGERRRYFPSGFWQLAKGDDEQ